MTAERWEQLCAVFAEARSRSAADREPFLRSACDDDRELFKEVIRLLEGDARANRQAFLMPPDGPPTSPSPDPVGQDHASAPALESDLPVIGRYRVRSIFGQGGFGRVYLALDAELDRLVAIKVPIAGQAGQAINIASYLSEARILARLAHPNIVPVYDVGRLDDGRCYVVSKYVEGGDLAARIARGRPSFAESAELTRALAEALHYAHSRDLFHRDIKPANILIDASGVPSLADFGVALDDEDFGKGARFVGTPSYMSPEQARGEGHLVDGRSDIFSLGIVFYELLTGRRPFRGDSRQEVQQQIIAAEPRPPRQIDDSIPRELERICLKALSKRASDRYSTAGDLAEDLRHFVRETSETASTPEVLGAPLATAAVGPTPPATPTPMTTPGSGLSGQPSRTIAIVPRGLSSFNEHDADFFLELLPGPRDRDGLPDSLRFWKTRIEATDPDQSFRVGIIYGPSGCGKSSLVKAGLIPHLAPHIVSVYVEATESETETRLLRGLRKVFPGPAIDGNLAAVMAGLRRNRGLRPGGKVLVVLDQFEQWLFARRGEEGTELVAALRQCDGEHVQALCLIRDDFWMAATRFMRDLEIELVPDRNIAAVDLFDKKHARKILAAYGRAYDALAAAGELSKEQADFLDRATTGLAQDGRVVPVRLALFAEMVKGRPWTPTALRELGGMDGVGVKFLEETFGSTRSNPKYRYHQRAAQAVLKALLPEAGADIKGRMRSVEELRDASGYSDRPADFAELVGVLDYDLRLIAPADPEGSIDDDDAPTTPAGGRSYQLTHDYLVHSLREWLTRKQRETRRGRAELRLAERAALWIDKPENRHLPSFLEWATIRSLARSARWTEPQRRMMRRAGRMHGLRTLAVAALIALMSWGGIEGYGFFRASALVESLKTANTSEVPRIVGQLSSFRRWGNSRLRSLVQSADDSSGAKLHASLALLPDEDQIDYIYSRMLVAAPGDFRVIRKFLGPHRSKLTGWLWDELQHRDLKTLLPAAGALALYAPDDARWDKVAEPVAGAMVLANPIHVATWLEIFRPVENKLRDRLGKILRDKKRPELERVHAANYLAKYVADSPGELVDLLLDSQPKEFAVLFPPVEANRSQAISLLEVAARAGEEPMPADEDEKDRKAERQANAAVALVRLGAGAEVWPLLTHGPDPRLRSFIIHGMAPFDVNPSAIAKRLRETRRLDTAPQPDGRQDRVARTPDPNLAFLFDEETSIRRGLILALGNYPTDRLAVADREPLISELGKLYREDPDPGIHGACEWTLRRWGQDERLRAIDSAMPHAKKRSDPRWSINEAGHTMVEILGPLEFDMGSPKSEPYHVDDERLHCRLIPRGFAIASKDVSIEQYRKYREQTGKPPFAYTKDFSPDADGPQNGVSWFDAAEYCNWLSKKERLTPCYKPNDRGRYAPGLHVDEKAVAAGAYRLPTEAEWEYACRAGSTTSRSYGTSTVLLDDYAWHGGNAGGRAGPCGRKLPNDLGLFDMLGNVWEWCHDRHFPYDAPDGGRTEDLIEKEDVLDADRNSRGSTFLIPGEGARSAKRTWMRPSDPRVNVGFRPARTMP